MKKYFFLFIVCIGLLFNPISTIVNAQGVGINSSGNPPDQSAMLDVSGTDSGVLINRMTTTQRDAITNPALSLLIFNTTTSCFEFYANGMWQSLGCACSVPTAVTANASPNPICAGNTLTLTGGATGATAWSWSGPNGFNSTLQSPTISGITAAGSGTYSLTASNACGPAVPVSAISVTVNSPAAANAGPDINPPCGVSTATLAGNAPLEGTGIWSVVSGQATITDPGSPTSGVTGLNVPGTATLRWTISNPPCAASTDDVLITTTSCFACGSSLTDSRDDNTYSTILIGTQCWMGSNLKYLPSVVGPSTGSQTVPYYYVYDYNGTSVASAKATSNYTTYGVLYNWPAAMNGSLSSNSNPSGVQGICPSGWHLPSDAELYVLENYLIANGGNYDGTTTGNKIAKSLATTTNWNAQSLPGAPGNNPSANNSSGFSAPPGGTRYHGGAFIGKGGDAYLQSSTEFSSTESRGRQIADFNSALLPSDRDKNWGIPVRCLKN